MNTKTFSEAISEIDDKYYIEADAYQPNRNRHRNMKWGVIAACICLLIGSAAALAASGVGTRLIETFTSRTEAGSDYSESGFDLSVAIERMPADNLSEKIQQAGEAIKQQFKDYKPYDSWYPGCWRSDFVSRDEACEYIGLDRIKRPDCAWAEQSTTLNVLGNTDGQILNVDLETYYTVEDVRLQFFTEIYTENYNEEINVRVRTTEDVEFSESIYTAKSGVQCHVIDSSAMESGYLCMDGYIVDQGVLYELHIAYLEKDAKLAADLLHQWADAF